MHFKKILQESVCQKADSPKTYANTKHRCEKTIDRKLTHAPIKLKQTQNINVRKKIDHKLTHASSIEVRYSKIVLTRKKAKHCSSDVEISIIKTASIR